MVFQWRRVVRLSRIPVDIIPDFTETVKKLGGKLGNSGRILLRASGTEPVIRIMVEGLEHGEINAMTDELCGLIRKADVN